MEEKFVIKRYVGGGEWTYESEDNPYLNFPVGLAKRYDSYPLAQVALKELEKEGFFQIEKIFIKY